MHGCVVLVIHLSGIEFFQRDQLRHNWAREQFCLLQLSDISLDDVFLLLIRVENHRAILRARVRPLAIELCGIMADPEKYLK